MRKLLQRLAAILLFTVGVSASAFAQASGSVRVTFVKAGLVAGGGVGSGVLTYRGRDYPFKVTGVSFGIAAGASVSKLQGRATGIRDIKDFSGTYDAVGGGGALVGGAGAVHLGNEKGVKLALRGPRAGVEFAGNVSQILISMGAPR